MKLKITKMEESHLSQVLAIEGLAFPTPWTGRAFLSELKENSFAYYIVCLDEGNNRQLVGYAGMWTILDEIHVTTIAVHEGYRGQRIGQLLLEYLFQVGRGKGAVNATLEVRLTNVPAQKLYKRLSFKACGLRKGYYQDNGEDAIVMWKEL